MKCPRCKNEVARLTQRSSTGPDWPEGLCDTCDIVERPNDVTLRAPANTPIKEPAPAASVMHSENIAVHRPAKSAGRPAPCKHCGYAKEAPGACPKCGKKNQSVKADSASTTAPRTTPGLTDLEEQKYNREYGYDTAVSITGGALPERVYVIELNEKQDAILTRIVDTGLCGPTPEQAIIRILDRTFVEAGNLS